MTPAGLQAFLDVEVSKIVKKAKQRTLMARDISADVFAGTVSGFLIKTGMALAAKHGAPRKIMEEQIHIMINEYWGST